MSNAALALLKEIKLSKGGDSPFNYHLLTLALMDIRDLFSKAQMIIAKASGDDELLLPSDRNLLLIYHATILRIQRILLASLFKHITMLLSGLGLDVIVNPTELEFTRTIQDRGIGGIRRLFPSLDLFTQGGLFTSFELGCAVSKGPRKLFSMIRVKKDCGTIQTEHGYLTLAEDSLHFVKTDDVRHLFDQGLVELVTDA